MRRRMTACRPMLSSMSLVLERNRLVMAANNVRVLSIQSHVVSGYVGNKSACFPLQVLGFEVDTINSVQFSNHTGYKTFKGHVLDNNQLGKYEESVSLFVRNPKLRLYLALQIPFFPVCDPVMGDHGKMYVPEDLLPVYKEHIIRLADIITPNQFEAELLSGRKIRNEADALEVMEWFHQQGVKTVVLSSTDLGSENELLGLASSVINGKSTRLQIGIPRLPVNFTGTGDLFASLLLGWMHHTDCNLKKSVENTVDTMQTILRRTLDIARQEAGPDTPLTVRHLELKLVQSLDDIRSPVPRCKASVLDN
ncbi:pyridoxal kinase-like [Penaeus japonicus]|uniref:pyridoxal kinase-like n=1 Tax=Penaeus japonicus TaxID=27405 RepID=UPI001C711DEB|nr:pyridoxal kinase-like [Penaeus japonicus]